MSLDANSARRDPETLDFDLPIHIQYALSNKLFQPAVKTENTVLRIGQCQAGNS